MSTSSNPSSEKSIKDIIEDLSYSIASPDVPVIMELIADQKWDQLKKSLKKHIDNEVDLNRLVEHHKSEALTDFDLVEVSPSDLESIVLAHQKTALSATRSSGFMMGHPFLIRMGREVISVHLVSLDGPSEFLLPSGQRIDPKRAHQVWKSVERTTSTI